MSIRTLTLGIPLVALPMFGGCDEVEEANWIAFNASTDGVNVVVGAKKTGPAVVADVHSTSGSVVVGAFSVDPGAAPFGTEHLVTVNVEDTWSEVVGRVTVSVDAGDLGIEEYTLRQDSANHGYWWVEVLSVDDGSSSREDEFTATLWQDDTVVTTVTVVTTETSVVTETGTTKGQ
jgi:hypothetical protein